MCFKPKPADFFRLKDCPKCGKKMEVQAVKCPSCGYVEKTKQQEIR